MERVKKLVNLLIPLKPCAWFAWMGKYPVKCSQTIAALTHFVLTVLANMLQQSYKKIYHPWNALIQTVEVSCSLSVAVALFDKKYLIDGEMPFVNHGFLGLKKFYCPYKDCSAMLVDDGGELVTASECPNCRRLFCAQCRVSWHASIECRDFKT